MDESSVTGESELIIKSTISSIVDDFEHEGVVDDVDGIQKHSAVLISGSTVNEGTAFGIVVAVGEKT